MTLLDQPINQEQLNEIVSSFTYEESDYLSFNMKSETEYKLVIDKSVALRENVDTSLVDVSNLSKIKFKLVAKENVIDMADGSVIHEAGKEIGTYNLSKEEIDKKLENSNFSSKDRADNLSVSSLYEIYCLLFK